MTVKGSHDEVIITSLCLFVWYLYCRLPLVTVKIMAQTKWECWR